jgi:uncharacterized protein (TIGR04255 family)
MAEYSLLKNAPITEALIDIRIKAKADFDAHKFMSLNDTIANEYPINKPRHRWEGRVEFKEGGAPSQTATDTIDGYTFTSADGKQLFQAQIDGFTFNRLKPYEKWETFRDEALRLWELYKTLFKPDITRIALRFINKIEIPILPHSLLDFDEYLTAAPIVPKELPQGLSSFLTRIVIHESSIDAVAIVTQVFEQVTDPRFIPIILDIDVFKQKDALSEEDAWTTFEELRHFKTEYFLQA